MFPPLPALQFLIDIDFLLFSKRTLPLTLQSPFSITFLKFLPNIILIYLKILQFKMPKSSPSTSTSTSLTFSAQTLPTSASTSHRYLTFLSLPSFPLKLNFQKLTKCQKHHRLFPLIYLLVLLAIFLFQRTCFNHSSRASHNVVRYWVLGRCKLRFWDLLEVEAGRRRD